MGLSPAQEENEPVEYAGDGQGRQQAEEQAPKITPSEFDVIVLGTGLPEALVAAAAAKAGRSVLHLEANSFYGGAWASLSVEDVAALNSGAVRSSSDTGSIHRTGDLADGKDDGDGGLASMLPAHGTICDGGITSPAAQGTLLDLSLAEQTLGEFHFEPPSPELPPGELQQQLGRLGQYCLNLCGPQLIYSTGPVVDTLLSSGAHKYLEFKALSSIYLLRGGRFHRVPTSRAEVFQDRSLSLPQKRLLMRFLKFCVEEDASSEEASDASGPSGTHGLQWPSAGSRTTFVEFLSHEAELSPELQDIILYTIVFASEPQQQGRELGACEGLTRVRQYLQSVSRFGLGRGAFLLPMYGVGELSEACCRVAAVHGAVYVLRQPVASVTWTPDECKATDTDEAVPATEQVLQSEDRGADTQDERPITIRLASGQLLKTAALAASDHLLSTATINSRRGDKTVARCVCIVDRPVVSATSASEEESSLLVIPPRSEASSSSCLSGVTRVLQVGSGLNAAPPGKWVLLLSCLYRHGPHHDTVSAETFLRPGVATVLASTTSEASEQNATDAPTELWSCFYLQDIVDEADMEATQAAIPRAFGVCRGPNESLDLANAIRAAEEAYFRLFPEEQKMFVREEIPREDDDDDDDSD